MSVPGSRWAAAPSKRQKENLKKRKTMSTIYTYIHTIYTNRSNIANTISSKQVFGEMPNDVVVDSTAKQ